MRVLKYELNIGSVNEILLHKEDIVRKIDFQHRRLMMWVESPYDSILSKNKRKFEIFATGQLFPTTSNLKYVGTAVSNVYVWHVYEKL